MPAIKSKADASGDWSPERELKAIALSRKILRLFRDGKPKSFDAVAASYSSPRADLRDALDYLCSIMQIRRLGGSTPRWIKTDLSKYKGAGS